VLFGNRKLLYIYCQQGNWAMVYSPSFAMGNANGKSPYWANDAMLIQHNILIMSVFFIMKIKLLKKNKKKCVGIE
jgi:hypothetical protein